MKVVLAATFTMATFNTLLIHLFARTKAIAIDRDRRGMSRTSIVFLWPGGLQGKSTCSWCEYCIGLASSVQCGDTTPGPQYLYILLLWIQSSSSKTSSETNREDHCSTTRSIDYSCDIVHTPSDDEQTVLFDWELVTNDGARFAEDQSWPPRQRLGGGIGESIHRGSSCKGSMICCQNTITKFGQKWNT